MLLPLTKPFPWKQHHSLWVSSKSIHGVLKKSYSHFQCSTQTEITQTLPICSKSYNNKALCDREILPFHIPFNSLVQLKIKKRLCSKKKIISTFLSSVTVPRFVLFISASKASLSEQRDAFPLSFLGPVSRDIDFNKSYWYAAGMDFC